MTVESDNIIIESRNEITLLQDIINSYIKHEKPDDNEKQALSQLNEELEALWLSW